ncbi:unnamed protein product [Calypogeia fissa]
MDHKSAKMTIPPGTEVHASNLTAEAHAGDLIPGIHDGITVDHITTKLTWRDIYVLSSVSRGWREAIRSRDVYNARVRHGSAETFLLYKRHRDHFYLYSTKYESVCKLPPTPVLYGEPVAVDGRVYVMGTYGEVHVLHLAGQWKPCLREQDDPLPCYINYEVMDGKIYAIGCEGFVYDPKQNKWSSTKPIPSRRKLFRVAVMRDEFVVYDGIFDTEDGPLETRFDDFLEFYHPGKDEWRVVESFRRPQEALFVAGGRFYSMSASEIHVYDGDEKTWTHLYSFAFAANQSVEPLEVVVADTELLARVTWSTGERPHSSCVFRSRGFGGLNKELHWQTVAVYPNISRISANFFGPTVSF